MFLTSLSYKTEWMVISFKTMENSKHTGVIHKSQYHWVLNLESMLVSFISFQLVIDWVGTAHCGWCYSFSGVLGSIRKQAEDAMRRKPVGSTPPWPLHLLLHPGSCQTSLSLQQDSNGNSNQDRVCEKNIFIGALFIGIIIIGYAKALKWIFFISTIKVTIEENRVVEYVVLCKMFLCKVKY